MLYRGNCLPGGFWASARKGVGESTPPVAQAARPVFAGYCALTTLTNCSDNSRRGVLTPHSPLSPLSPWPCGRGIGGLKRGFCGGRRSRPPQNPPSIPLPSPAQEGAEKVWASPPGGRKGIKEKLFLWWRLRRHHKNNILILPLPRRETAGEREQGKGERKRFPQRGLFQHPPQRERGGGRGGVRATARETLPRDRVTDCRNNLSSCKSLRYIAGKPIRGITYGV